MLLSAVLVAVGPAAAAAQDAEERVPNPRLELDLSQGLTLERDSDGEVSTAFVSRLGAVVVSETPISVLRLESDASLRLPLGGEDGEEDRFDGPSVDLSYRRAVPSSSFAVSASFSQDEVRDLDLSDFLGEDGSIDLPDDVDLADLIDEGTRRRLSLDAFLTLRDDRPLGLEFALGYDRVAYLDTTSPDLVDEESLSFAGTVRLDLTEVHQARATVRATRTEEGGAAPEVATGVDLEGSIERPDGRYFGAVSLDDDGERVALRVGRDLERPLGPISATLGASRAPNGEVDLVGQLRVVRALPNGRVALVVEQEVGAFGDDDALATTVAASFSRELSPLVGLSLDGLFANVRDPEGDDDLRSLELGASLSRALTPDWSLALGYDVEFRDDGDGDSDRVDSVSLNLQRRFVTGF